MNQSNLNLDDLNTKFRSLIRNKMTLQEHMAVSYDVNSSEFLRSVINRKIHLLNKEIDECLEQLHMEVEVLL